MLWFTSDTHFNHNRLAYERGFINTEEHDECLIDRWNSKVKPKDVVYLLGDVAFSKDEKLKILLSRLRGRIHLIVGNHNDRDKNCRKLSDRFVWIKDVHMLKHDGKLIWLSHYAHEVWPQKHYGSWHLHGHSHGKLGKVSGHNRLDVGVDTNNFYPYSLEEIESLLQTNPSSLKS